MENLFDKYPDITTLFDALNVISEQDRRIGQLTRQKESLEDTERNRNDWLYKAKKEAGYDPRISFDIVWKEVLEKSKKQ